MVEQRKEKGEQWTRYTGSERATSLVRFCDCGRGRGRHLCLCPALQSILSGTSGILLASSFVCQLPFLVIVVAIRPIVIYQHLPHYLVCQIPGYVFVVTAGESPILYDDESSNAPPNLAPIIFILSNQSLLFRRQDLAGRHSVY